MIVLSTAIEEKEISSKIPIAEVVTCSGFFLISFLEELIHHFIHPHKNKNNKKSKIHRQSGQTKNISHRKEFELYDARNSSTTNTSISTSSGEDLEEGLIVEGE